MIYDFVLFDPCDDSRTRWSYRFVRQKLMASSNSVCCDLRIVAGKSITSKVTWNFLLYLAFRLLANSMLSQFVYTNTLSILSIQIQSNFRWREREKSKCTPKKNYKIACDRNAYHNICLITNWIGLRFIDFLFIRKANNTNNNNGKQTNNAIVKWNSI